MLESPEWRGTREDVRSVGNCVAEVGLEYFCPDYVSKNGVSVTEHNRLIKSSRDGMAPERTGVASLAMVIWTWWGH